MKCLSLWQPWASAIAAGSKRIETRHWSTNYRGPILIHAAKRKHIGELRDLNRRPWWRCAMWPVLEHEPLLALPFGAIVAVAELVDCRRTTQFGQEIIETRHHGHLPSWPFCEQQLGDFSPGRFGWVLQNVRRFSQPIPYAGRQGLFEVPDHVVYEELHHDRPPT